MYPYNFTASYQTKNITRDSSGKPVRMIPKYIVLHHTASKEGTTDAILQVLLGNTGAKVSAHFLVNEYGQDYKLSEPNYITWHAGVSVWGAEKNLNNMSIGIEVIGPYSDGTFSFKTFIETCKLIQHLMKVYKIPKENILRHCDLTWEGSIRKELRDGKSTTRKVDINRMFWGDKGLANFSEFRDKCF